MVNDVAAFVKKNHERHVQIANGFGIQVQIHIVPVPNGDKLVGIVPFGPVIQCVHQRSGLFLNKNTEITYFIVDIQRFLAIEAVKEEYAQEDIAGQKQPKRDDCNYDSDFLPDCQAVLFQWHSIRAISNI
jgi:hypothetical protein